MAFRQITSLANVYDEPITEMIIKLSRLENIRSFLDFETEINFIFHVEIWRQVQGK